MPDGNILSGSQIIGAPGVPIGRSNHLAWAMTTSRCDTSDLWKEQLNQEGTKYQVDGVWKDLKVVKETIKIKGKDDKVVDIKQTHRGPIINFDLLRLNSELLFGGSAIPLKQPSDYSFAWQGGFYVGDDTFDLSRKVTTAKSIPELFDYFNESEIGQSYKGVGQNAIFADSSGNIGYKLMMTIPERKDKTPFLGARILDGTTSKFDWTDRVVPLKDLATSINPKKGFLMTANGRQTSD